VIPEKLSDLHKDAAWLIKRYDKRSLLLKAQVEQLRTETDVETIKMLKIWISNNRVWLEQSSPRYNQAKKIVFLKREDLLYLEGIAYERRNQGRTT
jgi:hypothetical protein